MAGSPGGKGGAAPRSAFEAVTGAMNAVGTLWIFVLMLLVNADIIGRSGFNRPLQGVNEIVGMSIVGIVFLQLTHTLRSGRFLRSELLGDLLGRWPAMGRALETFHNLLGLAVMAIMFYFGLPHFIEAWELSLFVGTFGQFTFPLWPVRLLLLVGVAAAAVQFLLLAADAARGRLPGHPSARVPE